MVIDQYQKRLECCANADDRLVVFISSFDTGCLTVVKLLSKRWWIPIGARPGGREQRWGSRPPTRGFRAFEALSLVFMASVDKCK